MVKNTKEEIIQNNEFDQGTYPLVWDGCEEMKVFWTYYFCPDEKDLILKYLLVEREGKYHGLRQSIWSSGFISDTKKLPIGETLEAAIKTAEEDLHAFIGSDN